MPHTISLAIYHQRCFVTGGLHGPCCRTTVKVPVQHITVCDVFLQAADVLIDEEGVCNACGFLADGYLAPEKGVCLQSLSSSPAVLCRGIVPMHKYALTTLPRYASEQYVESGYCVFLYTY